MESINVRYLDKVKFVSGFFEGHMGTIMAESEPGGESLDVTYEAYDVMFENGDIFPGVAAKDFELVSRYVTPTEKG